MFIKRIFCNHSFIKSVSTESERKGVNNYVYDCDYLECEKCGYNFTIKMLNRVEKGYYGNKYQSCKWQTCEEGESRWKMLP